jgi:hypothetical protein
VRTTTSETRRDEWLTVKVRYKLPEAGDSQVMSQAVRIGEPGAPGEHLPFAAAVAEFALLLRNGRPAATEWDALVSRLQAMRSTDPDGERLGFVHVVELAAGLQKLR